MRRLTKRPMGFAAVRLPQTDRELWFAASKVLGVSQSEFLRTALRERAERVLASTGTRTVEPR
jgi:hypothetical protein